MYMYKNNSCKLSIGKPYAFTYSDDMKMRVE